MLLLDEDVCYRALRTRDARFDGRFFIGVRTTGIYCRPICPARPPLRKNIVFFPCAAAAEGAGFRPCLRCRPETAPGSPRWVGTAATVSRALRLIETGALDDGAIGALAAALGIGERQLRRLFAHHLGTSPLAVAASRRAHQARLLLEATDLPVTQVAFASGYRSLRQFNDAMRA
ncbi:MAG TPA: Ada metal-binding domain-containing protein, partial [Myxococcales bacterium]|nr:Ada metal-binding domain-containing protein [Myxococcales bacterium]